MKFGKRARIKWFIVVVALIIISKNLIVPGKLDNLGASESLHVSRYSNKVSTTSSNITKKLTLTKSQLKKRSSDGYDLAIRINKVCNSTHISRGPIKVFGIYEWDSIETCIIWKIGTTFIKRLYMMKKLPEFHDIVNPYAIRFDKRYLPNKRTSQKNDASRFMFVRDPYKRLISGYVDKLLAPNPVYWKEIGIPAIKATRNKPDRRSVQCGHDLEFHEYVKYVIKAFDPRQKEARVDGHFDRMTTLCRPCGVNYDFVGKIENFAEDSLELARRLKLSNQSISLLETEGGHFSWLDAVKDTAHQPFDKVFQNTYIHCISFYEALTRSWKKMQIRGLIGEQNFPMRESQVNTLTEEQFVKLAIDARAKSTSEERKQLQTKHFLQMFSKVSKIDLEMVRRIYEADFRLFEYDDRPDILFGDK